MNFMGLIKRGDKIDKAFEELQADMADALDESLFVVEDAPVKENDSLVQEDIQSDEGDLLRDEDIAAELSLDPIGADETEQPREEAQSYQEEAPSYHEEAVRRMTSHTQSRLAALNSFDELYHDAQEHLQAIHAKLSEVTTSHHLTREFFNILHSDIHRANELELANAALAAEQRRLGEQLHDAIRKQQERGNAVEILQQREANLLQDKEALRASLAAVKLDLVEARNAISRNEAELGDLAKALSGRTVEAERRLRENEVLREKHVNLSIDLDKALKREAEARRKVDELSSIHANESARHSELLSALGKSEKEVMRLHKLKEIAQAKQSEMTEAASMMEADKEAESARGLAEMRGLRSEIQGFQSRLELASKEYSEASNEIAKLKVQLSDAIAEKHVSDERLATLIKENENDKQNLSTASANFSQLTLQQTSEQMQLDFHKQECENLRAEIESLNGQIKELLPYERLYRMKARQREAEGMDVGAVATETARAAGRRPAGSGRRRAV